MSPNAAGSVGNSTVDGDLTLTGTLTIDLDTATGDQLTVDGVGRTVDISGASLAGNELNPPAIGASYVIIDSTDPGTKNDMPSFANRGGHEYLGEKDDEGFTRFYIKVK